MSESGAPAPSRLFFLNEQHELAPLEPRGGGRLPKLAPIDWTRRGPSLAGSIRASRVRIEASPDPTRMARYFLTVDPEPSVRKLSSDKRKAPDGLHDERTDFGRQHNLDFGRLGLDLLESHADGKATVHATAAAAERLETTAGRLAEAGAREQARWVRLHSFAPVPVERKVDLDWFRAARTPTVDAVVALQPVLTRSESDDVLRAVLAFLREAGVAAFRRAGTEFSGRVWVRAEVPRNVNERLAVTFQSIPSITEPLLLVPAGTGARRPAPAAVTLPKVPDIATLPVVAVLDTGVPAEHPVLGRYLRGSWRSPDACTPGTAPHATQVASVVVFGGHPPDAAPAPDSGACRFLDVALGLEPGLNPRTPYFNEHTIADALTGAAGAYPDVRVFNLSLQTPQPLEQMNEVKRREHLLHVQDFDNFLFLHDAIGVVAAGNSPPGLVPRTPYPGHLDQPEWRLGAWACSYNALTCGASAGVVTPDAVAREADWPSPFTRIGPGMNGSPVPDLSAHGGNCEADYRTKPLIGVATCSVDGLWEDDSGTSFAAPQVAREAALILQRLQPFCAAGTRPYAATAKALMELTAQRPAGFPPDVRALADRTLGHGRTSASVVSRPPPETAILLWQGSLTAPRVAARVGIPIPFGWLKQAERPLLRLVCAWNGPVFEGAAGLWGCRAVSIHLRPGLDAHAVHARRTPAVGSYPLIDRTWDLSDTRELHGDGEPWILEIAYEQVAEYHPALQVADEQRVAFAAELSDGAEAPLAPQPILAALPVSSTMVRLSAASPVPVPVPIRRRG